MAYDRAGRVRTGMAPQPQSVDDMADDLVALIESVVPGDLVLVAHSMGGLVARRAAERLGGRLRGILLIDPSPETSPMYDDWDERVAKADRALALTQRLSRIRPLGGLFLGNLRGAYTPETRRTIIDEDFTPAATAQTRAELRAVTAAIRDFRMQPPQPPRCPVIVLAAARPVRERPHDIAFVESAQSMTACTRRAFLTDTSKASTRRTSCRPSSRN